MAVSRRLRYEILRRDNYTCRYCRSTGNELTVDHVKPTALGGTDDPSNLVAACKDCNAGKSSNSPDAALVARVDEDAVRWAAAVRRAAERWLAAQQDGWAYGDVVGRAWDGSNEAYRRSWARLPDDWTDSVEQWRALGIPAEMVADSIGVAMRAKHVPPSGVWRYACGVVWAKYKQLQADARQLLEDGEA